MIQTIFIIYAVIPIIIFIRAIIAIDQRIRKCRYQYAIPAIILICVNFICFYYLYRTNNIDLFSQISLTLLVALACLFFVLLFYKIGYEQEKILILKIARDIIQNYDT